MVTWQIVSGLRQAHSFRGGSEYPYPFNQFVNVIEFVMFDFFTFFHTECVNPTNYADKLMISLLTIVSLGVLAGVSGAMYTYVYGGTIMRSSSVKGYLLLIYTVLPTMSSMAFSAFNVDRVSEGQYKAREIVFSDSSHVLTNHHSPCPLEVRLRAGLHRGVHDRRPSHRVGQ